MSREFLGNIKGPKGDKGEKGEQGEFSEEQLNDLTSKINAYGYNVRYFGAVGDGVTDDTQSIQRTIDEANAKGLRKVYIPSGKYVVSSTINLNGCSVEGTKASVYHNEVGNGVELIAKTKDFILMSQGSASLNNIEFSVSNLTAKNALVGFEFFYVINSVFNNLLAIDCETGYVLGKDSSVGAMFNTFNNLYTRNCDYGVHVESSEYWNNNIFNNGYIQGRILSFNLHVNGGYGAVGNTFNNVEFRSGVGRGINLRRVRETNFNACYFETGGASVFTDPTQINSYTLNNCIYATFKSDNTNGDNAYIVNDDLGGRVVINGGTVFGSSQIENKFFYQSGLTNDYFSPIELSPINSTGAPSSFRFYSGEVIKTVQ